MRIVMTGVSRRAAPLEVREELSVTSATLPAALDALRESAGRGVILGTCDRTEVYTLAPSKERGAAAVERFIEAQFLTDASVYRPHLRTLEQDDAVEHLFRVASGLESQIIGESEVLGQVRDAFGAARRHGIAGGALAHLFHSALRTGKRARTETAIGRNALSVGRACTSLARRELGSLEGARALIVGVGEASRLAGVALRDAGAGSIVVANRSPANAADLARELNAETAPLDGLAALLADADVAVTATAAPDFVIGRDVVAEAASRRGGRPLVMMDLAVPRDVDPSAGEMEGVRLFTLDDLDALTEANRRERLAEARRVEEIVAEETARFREWRRARAVAPTIAAMRGDAERMRAGEVSRTLGRMRGLSADDAERIEKMTKALVKKMLHRPTSRLRERNDESLTQSARELFGLDG